VCTRLADRRRAALLYELFLPYAARNMVAGEGVIVLGAAAQHLGNLAALLGRWDEAEYYLQKALALDVHWGALGFLGQNQRSLGQMYLARGGPGDRERGLCFLDQARETAERIGAHGLRRRVLSLREQALSLHATAFPLP
jgi:hypothetical protein